MLTATAYQWQGTDLILNLLVQPRASKDEWVGIQADRIKLRLTAPPVDGKANLYLVKFLAREFGVAKSQIQHEKGETSRLKRVRIHQPTRLPAFLSASGLA